MYFVVFGAFMRRANGRVSRIFVLTGVSRVHVSVCEGVSMCVSICVNYAFGIRTEVWKKRRDPNEFRA